MLSVLGVFDALTAYEESPYKGRINPIFINVINSKDYYIQYMLQQWDFETHSIAEAGEVSSILGTVANIDKLPRYVAEKIEARGFIVEQIMMPHKITYENARAALKAEVTEPLRLIDSINKHNNYLDEALQSFEEYSYEQWGVVEPPLARVLGKPAVMYQRAMVQNHVSVRNTLDRIMTYTEANEELNYETQKTLIKYQQNNISESPLPSMKKKVKVDSLEQKKEGMYPN